MEVKDAVSYALACTNSSRRTDEANETDRKNLDDADISEKRKS